MENVSNFFSPYVTGEALAFLPWKSGFLVVFFFTKDLIYLVHLIHFLLLLSLIFSKQSLLLCFWRDSWWVCSLNYLVILSNYYVFLFIVRKCECSCVFYSFSNFHCVFKKRLLFICFVTVFWFLKDFQLKSLDF